MEATEGKRVEIRYICRREDGQIHDLARRDILSFIIGQGQTLPSLEKGVIGLKPGDRRIVRVPMSELSEFPFYEEEAPTSAHFPAGSTDGTSAQYNIAPDEEEDIVTTPATAPLRVRKGIPPSASANEDFFFEIELLSVEDADLELGADAF